MKTGLTSPDDPRQGLHQCVRRERILSLTISRDGVLAAAKQELIEPTPFL
jgi:hypothetical protein